MKDIRIFSVFGKAFIPKKLIPVIAQQFYRAGINGVPYTLFGMLFYLTLIITYFIYFPTVYTTINNYVPILFLFSTFLVWVIIPLLLSVVIMLGIYFYLDIKVLIELRIWKKN